MTETTDMRKIPFSASSLGMVLHRMWEPVRGVLTFSLADEALAPQKNLSVSIDRGSISFAYGSRFLSRITFGWVKEYSFDDNTYPQPEDLLSSLSLACSEFNTAPAGMTLSIPKAWTIVRTVEFPAAVKENIADVIAYELDRLTPLASGDAFYDFRVLEDRGDRISLLLMAAKADQVRPYIDLLNRNGFAVNRMTVNLSALGTVCSSIERKSDTIVMEIRPYGYEGGLFVKGLPVHHVSGFLEGLEDTAKGELISGDVRTMLTMTKDRHRTPQVVFLIKGKDPALRELLNRSAGVPVRFMEETDIGIKAPKSRQQIPYAAVGSVMQSLWRETNGLNLLTKGRSERPGTPLTLTILLMLSIALTCIYYLVAPLNVEERRLQEISRQIGPLKEEAKKVEALKKEAESLEERITAIDNFKHERIMTLGILKELASVLPKNTWLSRTRIGTTSVDIEGYAAKATELLPKLEASHYFRKVEFASPIMWDARMNSERFNIKMELEGLRAPEGEKTAYEKK